MTRWEFKGQKGCYLLWNFSWSLFVTQKRKFEGKTAMSLLRKRPRRTSPWDWPFYSISKGQFGTWASIVPWTGCILGSQSFRLPYGSEMPMKHGHGFRMWKRYLVTHPWTIHIFRTTPPPPRLIFYCWILQVSSFHCVRL